MTAKAQTALPHVEGPPKRRLRNFLLDRPFQLKYTGMVVAVTMLIAGVLGYFAYQESISVSESLQVAIASRTDLSGDVQMRLLEDAEAYDMKILVFIVGGVLLLGATLALTGIVVTHKVVGPAYKLQKLLGEVADGRLRVESRLRKGDELQNLFEAFIRMVDSLRATQAEEVAQLDAAIEKAKKAGVPDDALESIIEVRDRMQASLD